MNLETKKLLAAPFIGGLFVVFLPFIVWPLLAIALYKKAVPLLKAAFRPNPMTPGVAYLAGKPEEKGEPTKSPELDELQKGIDSRR